MVDEQERRTFLSSLLIAPCACTPIPTHLPLNLTGSRPQKRRPGGVETLRAIPWVFSWTQTRLHLSAWLGVGEAIETLLNDPKMGPELAAMYKDWPFFNTNLDLVDMILAKADVDIAGACAARRGVCGD